MQMSSNVTMNYLKLQSPLSRVTTYDISVPLSGNITNYTVTNSAYGMPGNATIMFSFVDLQMKWTNYGSAAITISINGVQVHYSAITDDCRGNYNNSHFFTAFITTQPTYDTSATGTFNTVMITLSVSGSNTVVGNTVAGNSNAAGFIRMTVW